MVDNADCKICGINRSKYVCPSCNISYCSVSCYQSEVHLQCSENFYEKWVQEELKNCHSDPEAKRKMFELLKQNHKEEDSESLDSDDDESDPDLATRMADVNLDDEESVWEKLTPEERKNFRKLVASGNIMKLLPEWEPWWKTRKKLTLIQECEDDSDWKTLCPAVPVNIPKLCKFIKSEPSPNIAFMMLNVLASYVYTVRYFKGCHKDMPVESISAIVALSRVLRNNQVFDNPVEAFVAFEDELVKYNWLKHEEYDKNTIYEDIMDIINGAYNSDLLYCVKAAINDLDLLCTQAFAIIKNTKTHHLKRFSGSPPKLCLLKQISKKLNFYLSWTVDYGHTLINMQFINRPNN